MGRTKSHFDMDENPNFTGRKNMQRERVRHETKDNQTRPFTSSKSAEMGESTLVELGTHLRLRARRVWRSFAHSFLNRSSGFLGASGLQKIALFGILAFVLFRTDLILSRASKTTMFGIFSSDDDGKGAKVKAVDLSDANSAAPVGAGSLAPEVAEDYIRRFAPVAIKEMEKFGIPASISLAQGLVESRAGTSTLARKNNNHFGIKCFSKKCKKGHCSNHTDDTHKDFFRKFDSSWESWRAHSQLLASGRYVELQNHGRDYKKWARGLKEKGYATDATYDDKIIGMIERFDLSRFDK